MNDFFCTIQRIKNLQDKYKDCYSLYIKLKDSKLKTLMTTSKETDLHGMFVPDKNIEYVCGKYKGRLTKKEEKKDFKYYFDEQNRVILTERYSNGKLLNLIFYFYNQDNIEIIWYDIQRMFICIVSEINYINEKISKLFLTEDLGLFNKYGIKHLMFTELLFNYKKLNITDSEFIMLIYLINQYSEFYNPKQISNDLKMSMNDVLECINSLCEKNIIKIELKKINNIRSEIVNLDSLYEKIAFVLNEVEEKNDSNLYSVFETEFGRTLSPMEFEIINSWVDGGYSEELIKLALKEATYNGVSNLRYIDKIIYEWSKKGIKTKEDVENDRKKFQSKNNKNKELFDYDWLNDNDTGNN